MTTERAARPRAGPFKRPPRDRTGRCRRTKSSRSLSSPKSEVRRVVGPAAALKEEINDSWRLLFGCVGATGGVTALLYVLASLVG